MLPFNYRLIFYVSMLFSSSLLLHAADPAPKSPQTPPLTLETPDDSFALFATITDIQEVRAIEALHHGQQEKRPSSADAERARLNALNAILNSPVSRFTNSRAGLEYAMGAHKTLPAASLPLSPQNTSSQQ